MNGRVLIAVALLALAAALVFAARPREVTADDRIDQITTELRCPVCQGLSVKD
jgi:cytochrome c-type biogenesis protein CcmH/NrfF